MEETKFFTKGKIITIGVIVVAIISIILGIVLHRSNLKKEYIKFENQLKYAAPNYILKEKIVLGENEWREIDIKKILSQKLVINKRANDCSGYVIAEYNSNAKENDYSVYIKCKKIYTTKGYGTKSTNTKKNNDKTQTEVDTEKPVITLFGDKEITLTIGDEYTELGAVANDNVDGDLTKKIKITGKVDTNTAGTYEVTYTVQDKAKNKSSIKRIINIKEKKVEPTPEPTPTPKPDPTPVPTPTPTIDTTKPIITFNDKDLYQTICVGESVNTSINGPYGYVARDNVDGNITSRVKITGDIGIMNNVGVYSLYYEVSDNAGNVANAVKNFSVKNCSSTIEKPVTNIDITSLSLSPNNRTISVGSTLTLTLTINPGNATNKNVTYSSSDNGVATVTQDGIVKAIKTGTTKIIAESSNGKKAVSYITVR